MEDHYPQCVKCTVLRCRSKEMDKKVPVSCPTEKYRGLVKETVEKYMLPENQAINKGWIGFTSKVMDPEKPRERLAWTRVDEIMEYARIRGMTRLGIATCGELLPESKLLSDILESNGFDVVSVTCLCGETDPQEIGMPGNKICNPIMQAEVLNREKTELNMMMGLCLGTIYFSCVIAKRRQRLSWSRIGPLGITLWQLCISARILSIRTGSSGNERGAGRAGEGFRQ